MCQLDVVLSPLLYSQLFEVITFLSSTTDVSKYLNGRKDGHIEAYVRFVRL